MKKWLGLLVRPITGVVLSISISISVIDTMTTSPVDVIEAYQKPDTRQLVDDPTQGPYQAIVHLKKYISKDIEKMHCTGFLIATNVVLTNKHCLSDAVLVIVERGVKEPGKLSLATQMKSTHFQVSNSKDYGVVFLPQPIPVAPFILQKFPSTSDSIDLFTAGYSGDKDYFTMWENRYHNFTSLKNEGVISGGGSAHGQSGSPLFEVEESRFVAKGILWGVATCDRNNICPKEQVTYFVPFTDNVLNEIKGWISQKH